MSVPRLKNFESLEPPWKEKLLPNTICYYELYALDSDNRLVPLEGEEIGELLARALKKGAVKRQPWYEPLDKLPIEPIIATTMDTDFETLLVDRPVVRDSSVVRD